MSNKTTRLVYGPLTTVFTPPAICTERFNVAGIYGDNPSRFAVIAGKPSCTGPAGKYPCLPLGTSLYYVQGTRLLARL